MKQLHQFSVNGLAYDLVRVIQEIFLTVYLRRI